LIKDKGQRRGAQAITPAEPPERPRWAEDTLLVPHHPTGGNWVCLIFCGSGALLGACFGHWIGALILALIGTLAFITPVSCWEFDVSEGRLRRRTCNGLGIRSEIIGYRLSEVVAVSLDISSDNEGGQQHRVSVVFENGEQIFVSNVRKDADRIKALLGVKKIETSRE
jgi:hypothetical protein